MKPLTPQIVSDELVSVKEESMRAKEVQTVTYRQIDFELEMYTCRASFHPRKSLETIYLGVTCTDGQDILERTVRVENGQIAVETTF